MTTPAQWAKRAVLPVTIVTYVIYAALAIAAIPESKQMFHGSTTTPCEYVDDSTIVCPVTFCMYDNGDVAGDTESAQYEGGGGAKCFDSSLLGNLVPVAASLSIVALCLLAALNLTVRLRRSIGGLSTAFSSGTAAGAGFGVCFLLFVAAWVFWAVALIGDYYAAHFGSIDTLNGQDVTYKIKGNVALLKAAGVFAGIASVVTIAECSLLVHDGGLKRASPPSRFQSGNTAKDASQEATTGRAPAAPNAKTPWRLVTWKPKAKVGQTSVAVAQPAAGGDTRLRHVDNPFFDGAAAAV